MKATDIIAARLADLDTEVGTLHSLLASLKERMGTARQHTFEQEGTSAATSAELEGTRLRAQQVEAQGRLDMVLGLRNRIAKWLEHAGPVETSVYKLAPPKSLDALQGQITETRTKVADLKHELAEVKRAPQPIENLREQVVAYVARIAKDGAPNVTIKDGKLDINFDDRRPYKYMAWLSPDDMVAKIIDHIGDLQAQNGRKPMTLAARDAKVIKLTDAIDDAERRETALVDAARMAGLTTVLHRADISIAAFLGVRAHHKIAA